MQPKAKSKSARVLVADADEESTGLFVRVLRSRGLCVETASRGLEALARVRAALPDLLVLDTALPEVHGVDVARKLRASPKYRRIPIIMTSGRHRGWRIAEDLREAVGVKAFLEKPVRINVLWSAVQSILGKLEDAGGGDGQRRMAGAAYALYREAVRSDRSGDAQGAIQRVEEAIRCDPFSAKLRYQLGVLYRRHKGMGFAAIEAFEDSVALSPRWWPALQALAVLYEREGFATKAAGIWQRAASCSPDEETAERIRAHLLKLL